LFLFLIWRIAKSALHSKRPPTLPPKGGGKDLRSPKGGRRGLGKPSPFQGKREK